MTRRFRLPKVFTRLRRSESGLAAIEIALFAPILGLLLLGGYDVARYISIRTGVDKVAFSVADVTAQYKQLTAAAMRQVFLITGTSLTSYSSGTNGVTVLTSVYLDKTTPKVSWQCYSSSGTGWTSKIGVAGGTATIDSSLLADVNDNVMVAEVFYKFTPVFSNFFKDSFMIYSSAVFRPRLGSLTSKPC